jgi:6-phosphogluconolactonase
VTNTEVIVVPTADDLAQTVAGLLLERISSRQAEKGAASIVLTGGGIGIATLAAVRTAAAGGPAVQWDAVDVWWGDERFVPDDDPDRNAGQAAEALLDHLPFDPVRVHPMAASGEAFPTPEAAAEDYAAQLAKDAADGDSVPRFDVLMLGIGPEGHIASIFPDSPASTDTRAVIAVHNCPKAPPTRVSMTFPTIQAADEVWLMVSGAGKAEAVRLALTGAKQTDVPAAGARGTSKTRWFLDADAASELPEDLWPGG